MAAQAGSFQFDSQQRAELLAVLEGRRLGDVQSREQFLDDVEIALGILTGDEVDNWGYPEEKEKEPYAVRMQIEDIKKQAGKLSAQLAKTYSETDDQLIEGIIGVAGYLRKEQAKALYEQTQENINTLRKACEWALDATKLKIGRKNTGPDREFVRQIALSYFKRFSKTPKPTRNGIFSLVLAEIAQCTGYEFRMSEKLLKSVLSKPL